MRVPLLVLLLDNEIYSEEESDEEDETAELMRELEKIKKERAEEKARQEREQSASAAVAREAEIATSNPLLNLAAALGQSPGINTTAPGTFSVKRRWDDGEPLVSYSSSSANVGHFRLNIQEPGGESERQVWPIR